MRKNELRRKVALAEPDAVLTPAALSPEVAGAIDDSAVHDVVRDHAVPPGKLDPMLERIERHMVKAALERTWPTMTRDEQLRAVEEMDRRREAVKNRPVRS